MEGVEQESAKNGIEVLLAECQGYKNNNLYLQKANEDLSSAVIALQNELAQMHNVIKRLETQQQETLVNYNKERDMLKDHIKKLEATISNNNGSRKVAKVRNDQLPGNSGSFQQSSDVIAEDTSSDDISVSNSGAMASVIINNNSSNKFSNMAAMNTGADININESSADSAASAANDSNFINVNKKKILQAVNADLSVINKNIKNSKCSNYTVKQFNKKAPVKISITNEKEIPIIKKALAEANISFHEYKWEQEKKKAFLIKGLTGIVEEDLGFIKQELMQAGLPDSVQLSIFKTGFMRSNPTIDHNTLLKLVLPPNCDVQIIKNIKVIDRVVVRLVPMKSSNIIQCKNCQGFGHSASGCQHTHKCVKCGADHFKNECPRTYDKSIKLKCCNCNGEHSANNLAVCAYFQKFFGNVDNNQSHINISSSNPSGVILKKPKQGVSNNDSVTYDQQRFPSFQSKISKQTSPVVMNSSSMPNRVNFNLSNNKLYSQVVASKDLSNSCANASCNSVNREILNKLDAIVSLVYKHEQLLSNINNHD